MPGTDASLDYWNQNKYQVDPVGNTGNAYSGFGSGGVSDVYGNAITGDEFNFNNSSGFDSNFLNASLNATPGYQEGSDKFGFGQNWNQVQGNLNDPNLQPWQRKMLETQGSGGLLNFTGNKANVGTSTNIAGTTGVPPTVAAPELTPEQLQYQSRVKALQGAGQSMSKFGSSMLGKEYEYNMFG